MALNHKQKRKLATRLRSEDEANTGVQLRHSQKWQQRKWQIQERVKRHQARAKYHSEVRKGQRGQKEEA